MTEIELLELIELLDQVKREKTNNRVLQLLVDQQKKGQNREEELWDDVLEKELKEFLIYITIKNHFSGPSFVFDIGHSSEAFQFHTVNLIFVRDMNFFSNVNKLDFFLIKSLAIYWIFSIGSKFLKFCQ